jgi:hypothetical protein
MFFPNPVCVFVVFAPKHVECICAARRSLPDVPVNSNFYCINAVYGIARTAGWPRPHLRHVQTPRFLLVSCTLAPITLRFPSFQILEGHGDHGRDLHARHHDCGCDRQPPDGFCTRQELQNKDSGGGIHSQVRAPKSYLSTSLAKPTLKS